MVKCQSVHEPEHAKHDANPVYVPIDSSYKPTANDINKAQKRPNYLGLF